MTEIIVLGTQAPFHHAEPLKSHYGERLQVVADYTPESVAAMEPDMLIVFEASDPQRALVAAEMSRRGVATLLVMDGIHEWRNTWTRTRPAGVRPLIQPAPVHKIACLGPVDARLSKSWGNLGKCELVGAPRLDDLLVQKRPGRTETIQGRPLRLLVMTARTPGFNAQETAVTLQSLRDLKAELAGRADVQVVWRLSKGLHLELEVENTFTSASGEELHQLLPQMDAVITTPSTTQLEAMLLGLPVALLNYHLAPVYTPAAWEIKCQSAIQPVLQELAAPPLDKMLYQDFCLNQALVCHSPALPRLVNLIDAMLRIKREHDLTGQGPLTFPARLLAADGQPETRPSPAFDLEKLYPNHPVFGNRELTDLQSELDAALLTVEQLHRQVDLLTRRLHRIPGYTLVRDVVLKIQRRFFLGGHTRV